MAPVRSAYAGGYSEFVRRQLDNVVIPDKVKCETCKKIRMQSAFSKRQLETLRNAIVVQGAKAITGPGYAKCRNCVGVQTVELRCCICDQVKGLELFAKSQRQNRDMARCLDCVQNHTETDPVLDETKLLEDDGEPSTAYGPTVTTSQIGDGSTIENFKPHGSLQYLRSASMYDGDGGGGGGGGGGDDDENESVGGGVWLEPDRIDENSTGKGKGRMFTGYDDQGTAHRRRISISQSEARSVHTGWESWGVVPGTPSSISDASKKPQSPSPKKKESKFAKVPAYKPSAKRQVPVMRVPEPVRETAPSDDEDANEAIEDFL